MRRRPPEASVPSEAAVRRLLRDRRAAVAITFAVLLPVFIGFAGLATETGLWYAIKRQNQSAADEGALAGAQEAAEALTQGNTPTNSAVTAAANCGAWRNGFDNSASNPCGTTTGLSGLTVTYPYTDSATATPCPSGSSSCVEVVLDSTENGLFAAYFMPSVTIETRAVAKYAALGSGGCDLALNTTASKALYFQGDATLNAPSCFLASNSNSADAADISGNSTITAAGLETVGHWSSHGNPSFTFTYGMYTDSASVANPYSSVTYPDPWTLPCQTFSQTGTLTAGAYCVSKSNPTPMYFQNGANATLCGVYYLLGEDNQQNAFRVDTGATVNGCASGVTIIATSSNGHVKDAGGFDVQGGTINLTAPSSSPATGIPSGLLFYQDPAYVDTKKPPNSTITASSTSTLTGAIVTPDTNVTYTGNSTSTCTTIVADTITFIGNSTMSTAGCAADGVKTPQIYGVAMVE